MHALSVVDMEVATLPERFYPTENISEIMSELRTHNVNIAQKAVDEAEGILKGRYKVEGHVTFGVPEAEILRVAAELHADLVVMGSKGLHGIKGALLGSVSMRVVRYAGCSVLVARHSDNGQKKE